MWWRSGFSPRNFTDQLGDSSEDMMHSTQWTFVLWDDLGDCWSRPWMTLRVTETFSELGEELKNRLLTLEANVCLTNNPFCCCCFIGFLFNCCAVSDHRCFENWSWFGGFWVSDCFGCTSEFRPHHFSCSLLSSLSVLSVLSFELAKHRPTQALVFVWSALPKDDLRGHILYFPSVFHSGGTFLVPWINQKFSPPLFPYLAVFISKAFITITVWMLAPWEQGLLLFNALLTL